MLGKTYASVLLLLAFAILSPGCSPKGADSSKRPAGKFAVAVEVAKVVQGDTTEGVEAVGSLSAKFQADVRPEFAGVVKQVFVTEWEPVRKGTRLAELDVREIEISVQRLEAAVEAAKAALKEAEVARNRADREYDRLVKLKEVGLVTQQALDDGTTEKEAAAARLSAAAAQLSASEREYKQMETHVSKALICSPMNGVVSLRNVNVGDLVGDVGGTKVLFHIVDNQLLDLTVTVPSSQMAGLKVGQPLVFSTDALPGKTFTGKVTFINPAVGEVDRSVKVVVQVQNDSGELKTGLFVKGRIITGTRTGITQVPRTALLVWDLAQKKADVFVVRGSKVERKAITTGVVSMDLVEATSGVSAGDVVVTRGGFNLKDGDPVNVVEGSGR